MARMKPVTVTVTIDRPRDEIHAFLEHGRSGRGGRALERLKEQMEAR
jgi:hypothetical protein